MTYITIYDPDVNPDRPRAVDLVRHRTPDHETELLFDLRPHFRGRYLDEELYEEHLRAAALAADELATDELAVEFALLLLTTMEPGWGADDRTCAWWHGREAERSALLAHAIAHPYEWTIACSGLVRDARRGRLIRVELRHLDGRLAIVALDPDRPHGSEYVPLFHISRSLSPGDLFRVLFSMLPAIDEFLADEPEWAARRDEAEHAAMFDPAHIPDGDAPHLRSLRWWADRAGDAVTEAIKCAKWDPAAGLNGRC